MKFSLLLLSVVVATTNCFADTPSPQLRWGLIKGTLSDQIDLQNALNNKMNYVIPSTSGNVLTSNGSIWISSPASGAIWGSITGTLGNQTDLAAALSGKEPSITSGTTFQYWRGDKTFQTLNTSIVPELTNLYFTTGRAQSAINATSPLTYSTGVVGCQTASGSQAGCLSAADWTIFNTASGLPPVRTVTTNYTLTGTDRYLFVNSAGSVSITLPSSPSDGVVYIVKNINTGAVTLLGTVDGATNAVMSHLNESLSLVSLGGNWKIW